MSKRKKNWLTVKFIFGSKVRAISITPLTVVLVLTLIAVTGWFVKIQVDNRMNDYQAQIEQLQTANENYRSVAALKEREREQMLALAEERFDELCAQINKQDDKINKISSTVGNKNTRRTLKGSRSGSRVASLDLKLRYIDLIKAVDNREVDIDNLKIAVNRYRTHLQQERERLQRERERAARSVTPSGWPSRGIITSNYGWRMHPIFGYGRFHSGMDIADDYGTTIVATAAGRVTYSGWMSGYGNAVIIDHGNGLQTLYGHCSSLNVNVGQYVNKGQSIAAMGSTGNSTGPHVHYEVLRNGQCTDPMLYM